jgi:hypothetical protein
VKKELDHQFPKSVHFSSMLEDYRSNPQYWNLLDSTDKAVYVRIRAALSAPTSRNKRGKRLDAFSEILAALHAFVSTDKENQWKRCLVCGFCLIPIGIAVNTTQLKKLVFKCKSTINASLKFLGFGSIITQQWAYDHLAAEIPFLRERPVDIRQWTIRVTNGPQRLCVAAPSVERSAPPEETQPLAFADCWSDQEIPEDAFVDIFEQ